MDDEEDNLPLKPEPGPSISEEFFRFSLVLLLFTPLGMGDFDLLPNMGAMVTGVLVVVVVVVVVAAVWDEDGWGGFGDLEREEFVEREDKVSSELLSLVT